MAAQHFSAIIVGGRRGQMVSRFFCSRMRGERGKASRPGPGCGTSRTRSQLNMFYHWIAWRLWQPQGCIPGGTKGNDHISIFENAAEQTSKMTSLNVKLPGSCFICRSHNLVSECRINQSQRLLINSAHSAVKVRSWDSHVVPYSIVWGGVLLSATGPILLCALIGLPVAAVE